MEVRDIGIPAQLTRETVCDVQTVTEDFVRWAVPRRRADGHKGTFGKLAIVGGSVSYTGAPALAARGAERSGCGLVYLGVPESIWAVEAVKCQGAMAFPLPDAQGRCSEYAAAKVLRQMEQCDVLALGPGLGRSDEVDRLVWTLLREVREPVVLDADGINALESHIDVLDARRGRVTILTPHDGEFARIGGDLAVGRVEAARRFAREHGCVLVLKGHRTVTAGPEGNVLVNTTGNSGMAKGGSGDVLTGVIASLLCQGATPMQAAGSGVWLHGRAGDIAAAERTEYGMTPWDLAEALPAAFQSGLGGKR